MNSIDVIGLAYDPVNNVLWGSDLDAFSLATIDRGTGQSNVVGPYGGGEWICGLAYDQASDTLYGIGPDNLYIVNRASGAATLVGSTGVHLGGVNWCIGLGITADTGVLFASDDVTGNLYYLNKTTGTATLVGSTGVQISGLDGALRGWWLFFDGFESKDTSAWSSTTP